MIDAKKGVRNKTAESLWYSASLCDTLEESLIVIKQVTLTKGFTIFGCDYNSGAFDVTEISVKNPGTGAEKTRSDIRNYRSQSRQLARTMASETPALALRLIG